MELIKLNRSEIEFDSEIVNFIKHDRIEKSDSLNSIIENRSLFPLLVNQDNVLIDGYFRIKYMSDSIITVLKINSEFNPITDYIRVNVSSQIRILDHFSIIKGMLKVVELEGEDVLKYFPFNKSEIESFKNILSYDFENKKTKRKLF